MTMTVGETKIELIAGDGATGQELSASDLVSALTGNAAQYGLSLKVNGADAATLDGMTINGQTFEVSADAGVDYRLNFVQKNPPQTAADEVNGLYRRLHRLEGYGWNDGSGRRYHSERGQHSQHRRHQLYRGGRRRDPGRCSG